MVSEGRIKLKKIQNMLLTFNRIELLLVGCALVVIQGCGITAAPSGWGLDASWVWMTENASRTLQFSHGSYIWTYGPLSFLDFQQATWKLGFLLDICFRVFTGTFFCLILLKSVEKYRMPSFIKIAIGVIVTTFLFEFNSPSMVLLMGMFLFGFNFTSNKLNQKYVPFLFGFFSFIEFYIKGLQALISILISILVITQAPKIMKNLLKYIVSYFLLVVLYATYLGFTIKTFLLFLRGNFELAIGYKAMGIEDHSRILEYPAIFALLAFICYKTVKSKFNKVTKYIVITTNLLFFDYGFTRHDGHSIAAFTWSFLTILAIYMNDKQNLKQGYVFALTFAIFCCVISTNFSVLNFFDLSSRLQNFRMATVLLEGQNFVQFEKNDNTEILTHSTLQANFLHYIGKNSLAIFPFDQLVAKPYQINLDQPPIPQLYAVYTQWLDNQDAQFFSKENAPSFILDETPAAIDGRNPIWEAPQTEITIFCNYKPLVYDSNWLLLEKRKQSICSANPVKPLKQSNLPISNAKVIETFTYKRKMNLIDKFITLVFKQPSHDVISTNSGNFTVVAKNNEDLILKVPINDDFPGPWSLNNSNVLLPHTGYSFSYSYIPLSHDD